jgi:osmotically-inducible protein OsmY
MAKTDAQIQHEVMEELAWDARVKSTNVGVEVDAGVVTLTGTVDSWAARLAAQEAAHRVDGVLDVANDVRVKLPGSPELTDADVAKAVRHALVWDVLVPHERITSTVSNGFVTLAGAVSNWTQHDDAARRVRNLAGVREVINTIEVVPPSPRPEPKAVRRAIESALERRATRAAGHVSLAVSADKVTLTGEVSSRAELKAVVGAVRGSPGVRFIDNQLSVRGLSARHPNVDRPRGRLPPARPARGPARTRRRRGDAAARLGAP